VSFLCLGLGASINVAKPPKGSTVAIFGLGAVGLAVSAEAIRLFNSLSTVMRMCVGFASDYPAYIHDLGCRRCKDCWSVEDHWC
jgi:Zn-dependent alcohol dehydrogenase